MSYRSHILRGSALAALAVTMCAMPSVAHAGTVQTYGSFDQMPPWLRAVFVGLFVVVGLVLVAAVVLNVRRAKPGPEAVGDVAAEAAAEASPTPASDPFAGIAATDAAFSEERFKARVNEAFLSVKYAWAACDMAPVRRFMTDEQYAAANVKLQAEFVARGRTPGIENLFVTSIVPTDVSTQGEFDSVTVLVEGSVVASTTDERTGKLVNPSVMGDGKTPRPFREAWTMLRKRGVQSKSEASLQQCPNCLAPVGAGTVATCAYCGAVMNDPNLDWVVARIEHAG